MLLYCPVHPRPLRWMTCWLRCKRLNSQASDRPLSEVRGARVGGELEKILLLWLSSWQSGSHLFSTCEIVSGVLIQIGASQVTHDREQVPWRSVRCSGTGIHGVRGKAEGTVQPGEEESKGWVGAVSSCCLQQPQPGSLQWYRAEGQGTVDKTCRNGN